MKARVLRGLGMVAVWGLVAWGCSDGAGPGDSGILLCTADPDCPQGLACLDGLCVLPSDGGCTFDADCPTGQVCRQGECVTEPADGGDGEDGDGSADGDGPPPEPAVAVEPTLIDFGNGRVGQVVEQILRVRSVGGADLTVFSLQMSADASPEFGAAPLGPEVNEILPPGANLEVRVTYAPMDGSVDFGTLLISTDAPSQALVQVPLSSSYKGVSEISVVDEPGSDLDSVQQVDFGPVALGGESRRVVFIKNAGNGNAVLEIEEVRTNPVVSDHFSLEVNPAPPAYLSPSTGPCALDEDCGAGNLCQAGVCLDPTGQVLGLVSVTIDFAPGAVGAIQETLVIANDEGDGAGDGDERVRLIVLRGEGIQPNLSVEPNPIEFETLFTGQQAELPVTLRNTGGQPLVVQSISLQDGSGPFSLDTSELLSWTLGPGESGTFQVSYAPLEAGDHQDLLEVVSDDPEGPALVDVRGRAVLPPAMELEPEALDFGEVQLTATRELGFLVRNTGGGPLQVTGLELTTPGGEFSLVQNAVPTLGPGETAWVAVRFAPAGTIGADANLVRVRGDDPERPEAFVSLAGLGTDPRATVDPASVDFGDCYPGFTVGPQVISIRNEGFGALRVESATLVGSADFAFAAPPGLPATLAFGQAVQLGLNFTPAGAGARSAELVVITDDLEALDLRVAVTGRGSDCPYGWWDANHDPSDGCEYECELTQGGVEICDGLDNNCDQEIDEGLTTRACEWETPGVGTCLGEEQCQGEIGWVNCDAAEPLQETCDAADNDCDGAQDGQDNSLRLDACELQAGVCLGSVHRAVLCQGGDWQVCQTLDYGADYGPEVCDRRDSDCDGLTDADDPDLLPEPCSNQSGVCGGAIHAPSQCFLGVWQDCTPAEYLAADARYGAEVCDGADNNCNGSIDQADGALVIPLCEVQVGLCAGAVHRALLCNGASGWLACLATDYDANNALYNSTELCDGVDNDCSGTVPANEADADGDGYRVCDGDCNDVPGSGAAVHPGAAEICDGIDNDCDGFIDGADPQLVLSPCELALGVCANKFHRADQCAAGGVWAACDGSNYGASFGAEICDAGLDNDCDGQANAADPSLTLAPCENQAGVCNGALHARAQCQANGTWQACAAAEYLARDPRYGAEVCDGVDNNCNSQIDQVDATLARPLCENQTGLCAGAMHRASLCNGAFGWLACDATDYEANDPDYNPFEICDRIDNDCSGSVPAGEVDGDGDGYAPCEGDCRDNDIDVNPGEQEICNTKDDDCDGFTDGLDGSLVLAPCELQAGVCAGAVHALNQCVGGGWLACTDSEYTSHSPYFGDEVCGDPTNRDEDCSGALDDRDADLDGHLHIACGGDDCNDDNPSAYPGAVEVQDLTDNDCDGLVDESTIPVGTIIVTEMMVDPNAVGDTDGEWFEVYNDGSFTVNMHSWRVRDEGVDGFVINQPAGLFIAPDQSMVFCRKSNPAINGGVTCDYTYGELGDVFLLGNNADEILLTLDGLTIDRVAYTTTTTAGRSRNLDAAAYDHLANDTPANWCMTPASAGYRLPAGDYGTPRRVNPSCSGQMVLTGVEPASGIELGGETITLTGTSFTGATAVSVCGSACSSFTVVSDNAITCVTPAHTPADCDVAVTKAANTSTLAGAYRYTGVTASPGIGWCDLQWPFTATARVNSDSELIFGRVWKSGVTEPAGAPAGITAQLGYGPQGSDPRSTVGWRWLAANWNPSCSGCGNNDEFMRQFNLPATGTWSYVYRFSEDGGFTFVFCDFDPGAPPFSTGEMGTLTVTP